MLEAVAYKVSPSVWIFKMRRWDGEIYYSESEYAISDMPGDDHPSWGGIRASSWHDPVTAIHVAHNLPPDPVPAALQRKPVVPPVVRGNREDGHILFDPVHVPERDIRRAKGQRVSLGGREWVSFEVH